MRTGKTRRQIAGQARLARQFWEAMSRAIPGIAGYLRPVASDYISEARATIATVTGREVADQRCRVYAFNQKYVFGR